MSVSRHRTFWLLAMLALSMGITSGCGDGRPSRVPVSGQVLLDEKPLREGFIRVIPQQGRMATGRVNSEGRFTLTTYGNNDGCIPGTHGVEIVCYDASNPAVFQSLVPDRYQNASTSGLTVSIDGPTDSLTINLSSKGRRNSRRGINIGDTDHTSL